MATKAGSGSSTPAGLASPGRHSSRFNGGLDLEDLRVGWEPFRRAMRRNVRLSQSALNDKELYLLRSLCVASLSLSLSLSLCFSLVCVCL